MIAFTAGGPPLTVGRTVVDRPQLVELPVLPGFCVPVPSTAMARFGTPQPKPALPAAVLQVTNGLGVPAIAGGFEKLLIALLLTKA
ncbi:MAG: hypothetical protein ACRDK5_00685 [Solirubrobacterales bacterium]